ncbi:UDP-N-acetylmuramoyl-L-alanine--D-glutamate ligase [Gleimia hominis]|uniref:UDP-N-acetylmuramoylalanine--D-glutamate ligase n=1 Tax=Gleimia hominis TaxID=595468 RepID=A0ABU3ICU6_9ACTO|nr:UDP-N-acetylmuramoyl-L-alanine--D-glutamate ligase [Gleimia hominis]MDT3768093.1 UDP-N-acetylmuramoyl-L-alanine--D-glutamate ligase [Gleimia hominis]
MIPFNKPIAVVGLGKSGCAAARVLTDLGAQVVGFDRREVDVDFEAVFGTDEQQARAVAGYDFDIAVLSPGVNPRSPIWRALKDSGCEIWGEVELAWRVQQHLGKHIEWLTVTGTNGKTTTVSLLGSMLQAAGARCAVVGNVGTPIVEAVAHADLEVVAVELSSFQLYTTQTVQPLASVCLNVDADHLDWHGSLEAYREAKARVYLNTRRACVYDATDPMILKMVQEADVVEGARAIGYTVGIPSISELGLVEGQFVDRAFIENREREAQALAKLDDMVGYAGQHPSIALVKDTLAAMALARAWGASPDAIAQGMHRFTLANHRRKILGQVEQVTWIDDSKATNAHAALASMVGFPNEHVVWIVGGDTKGQDLRPLVSQVKPLLRGVIVIGADPKPVLNALEDAAPQVPKVVVDGHEDWMFSVVNEAVAMSRPEDTVILAPACASWDQFNSYNERGDAFQDAVERLAHQRGVRL